MHNNIKHIIQGCIDGDPLHQTALFNYIYPKAFKISYSYTKDEASAQDIIQLGFIKIFDNLHKYSFKNSLALDRWVYKIITNTTLDELRKIKYKKNLINIENDIIDNEETPYSETQLNIIHDAIETLPPRYKEVFKMYAVEDYTHKEISQMLNINEGSSKSNLFKAKNKLKYYLKDKLLEE